MLKIPFLFLLGTCLVLGSPTTREDTVVYRLPKTATPSKYDIEITPKFPPEEGQKTTTFTGKVTITAKVSKKPEKIVLHAGDMTIKTINIAGKAIDPVVQPNKENDFLEIKGEMPDPGTEFSIIIEYEGNMRDDMYGFYVSSYEDSAGKTQWLGSTQMQPTHARRVFPCFDEPEYKATFKITINAPKGYTAISNMKVETPPSSTADPAKFVFKETPKMSTYLVAFMVTNTFKAYPSTTDDKMFIQARPEAKSQTVFARNIGGKLLSHLSDATGIDFYKIDSNKFEKMDMAAIPDFSAGAMENWGLLTFRETALLYDNERSTKRNKQRVASVVAHEQAHQWFGDLVTLTWWDNTWLNEGFATYFEYHAVAAMKDTDLGCKEKTGDDCWEMKKQFVIDEHQTALAEDAVEASNSLTTTVNSPTEIRGHFGTISYNKGGSVIRMMEHFLGSEVFKKSLQSYLNTHKLGNTVPKNLFSKMDEELAAATNAPKLPPNKKMEDVMDSWITKSGYPLITVTLKDKELELTQERFLLTKKSSKEDEKTTWIVPIKYATKQEEFSEDKSPKHWFVDETSNKIPLGDTVPDFIVLNVLSTGYYRVKYDEELLKKISVILNDKEKITQIDEINRAQLVDDILNIARADKMSYKDAFNFLEYLKNEDSYYAWSSTFAGFRFLLQRYSESDSVGKNLRKHLEKWMKGKLYKEKLFEKEREMGWIDTYNRVNTLEWACNLGDAECIEQAKKVFNKFKKTPETNNIPVDFRSIVYCTAMREEEIKTEEKSEDKRSEYFKFLWEQYKESNVAAEKITILNAIGCSKNDDNLNTFLQYSLNAAEVRKQDANYVFSSVYTGNSAGVSKALAFLEKNWAEISESYGGLNAVRKAVSALAGRLTKEEDVKKLKDLIKDKEEVKDIVNNIAETMDANLLWAKNKQKEISEYLCGADSGYEGCSSKNDDNGPGGAAAIHAGFWTVILGVAILYLTRF